jgi:hypothetical protein
MLFPQCCFKTCLVKVHHCLLLQRVTHSIILPVANILEELSTMHGLTLLHIHNAHLLLVDQILSGKLHHIQQTGVLMCKLQKQQFKCNMQPSSSRNHSEDTDREDLLGWNKLVAVPNHQPCPLFLIWWTLACHF